MDSRGSQPPLSRLLLDSGVWLAAADPQEAFHHSSLALVEGGEPLAALDLTLYEVANIAVRRRRAPEAARALTALLPTATRGRILLVEALIGDAITIAHDESLSVYDAAYVAAARRTGATLVSTDLRDLVEPGHAVAPDAI